MEVRSKKDKEKSEFGRKSSRRSLPAGWSVAVEKGEISGGGVDLVVTWRHMPKPILLSDGRWSK